MYTATLQQPSSLADAVVVSLNYADETRETAQDFPLTGAKRYDCTVRSARHMGFTLEKDGFTLVNNIADGNADGAAAAADEPWQTDPHNDDLIKRSWYPEAAKLAKKMSGAVSAVAVQHVHRRSDSAAGHEAVVSADFKQEKAVLNGVDGIHADFTPSSRFIQLLEAKAHRDFVRRQLAAMGGAATPEQVPRKRFRVRVVNIWQSISDRGPIARKPLAFCHPASVDAATELRENYKPMNGNTVWNAVSGPEHQHQWFYYPAMRRGEMLVFYGYDGERTPVLHTAFDLPANRTPAGAPPRESLETRVLCIFEENVSDSDVSTGLIPQPRL